MCGTRGWPFDDTNAQDAKIMAREAGRLRMSLQAGGAQKIAFLHYPPVYPGGCAQPLVDILHEFGVQQCYYGHLHGKSIRGAIQREVDGIRYKLVSADGLHFALIKSVIKAFVCSFFQFFACKGNFISKWAGILCRYMI